MTGRRRAAAASAPPRPTRTEQQTEEDARAYVLQQAAAARQAVRYWLIRGHGCTGPGCASERHAGDVGKLRDALMCLGVIPDPLASWQPGPGYGTGKMRHRVVDA